MLTLGRIYGAFWSFVLVASYQKWTPGAAGSSVSGGTSSTASQVLVSIFLVAHCASHVAQSRLIGAVYWTEETVRPVSTN